MVGLRVDEMWFWPAKTRKILNFLRYIHVLDLVLNYSSHKNERNWVELLFYFNVLMEKAAVILGLSFFKPVYQVLDWSFLVLQYYGNVCSWNPKVIWPPLGYFGIFCWNMPQFVDFISAWTNICKNCSIVILFWRHQFFSLVWGVFTSVLWKCL